MLKKILLTIGIVIVLNPIVSNAQVGSAVGVGTGSIPSGGAGSNPIIGGSCTAGQVTTAIASGTAIPTCSNNFAFGAITASNPWIISQEGNNAAVAFNLLSIDYTATADNGSSNLIRARVNGTNVFTINESGGVTSSSGFQVGTGGAYTVNASSQFMAGFTLLWSPTEFAPTDSGIARSGIGIIKITDGSSGYGTVDAKFSAEGTSGATHSACSIAVTAITVKDGLVTAITCT